MKTIATINADFAVGPLGLKSRLNDDLAGETVIRRTLKRLCAVKGLAGIHLLVHPSQEPLARESAAGLEVKIETHDAGPTPWHNFVSSARKWSLESGRGGLGGATVFDESAHPWVLDALVRREGAEAVVDVSPAAALLDPALLEAMIDHLKETREQTRMAFTQSAPGLSAAIYLPSLLADLAKAGQPPGQTMMYNPAAAQRDMIMQQCYYSCESVIAHGVGRCIADTQTAMDRMTRIIRELGNGDDNATQPDAASISRWLADHRYTDIGSLPVEVEIELTTEDPLPESTLRPRGSAVGKRGPMDEKMFARLIEELAGRDDIRVVLGGFGDPLMHPQWPEFVKHCRKAGIFALAVRTPAVHLDQAAIDTLIDAKVDVLNVLVDATQPDTYKRLHKGDHFEKVQANIEAFFATQVRLQQPRPIVVPEMIKTPDTMDQMEAFYDRWITICRSAVLAGPSNYAGQWPDLSVVRMAPPTRRPCSRLFNRAMILADGRVPACDQDFKGQHTIGSLADSTLTQIWTSTQMNHLRQSHLDANTNAIPMCPKCDEWHRP